ncbi:MAG: LON peptidase substrate-binding domain-containing protein [Saprospiraceae bacterium]|nr:LON peptidase substrate-binding domain-containing protein [Saprospiraceae bacterium]MBK9721194.1 LON peptidase substrate-binding domain-containing protein [Saprospiraceae bacterium]
MPKNQKIPVFPLPIVVFPDEELRLHIFEAQYKQLINDCKETGIVFGITPVIESRMMNIGSLVKLLEIVKVYDDGRMDIKLHCMGQFKVLEQYSKWPGKLYSAIDIQILEPDVAEEKEMTYEVMELFNNLCDINKAKPYHQISWETFQSYKLGHIVGFTLEEEYRFSTLATEKERLEKLIQQLDYMIEQSKQRQEWLKRMNMNGEFRNFNLKDLK